MSEALRKRLLDPAFRYVKASETDVSKTWARVRRQLKEAEAVKQAANVKPIRDKRSMG